MPGPWGAPRGAIGGIAYHVVNGANSRVALFEVQAEHELFEWVLERARGAPGRGSVRTGVKRLVGTCFRGRKHGTRGGRAGG